MTYRQIIKAAMNDGSGGAPAGDCCASTWHSRACAGSRRCGNPIIEIEQHDVLLATLGNGWTGLEDSQLHDGRDLAVTTDYRTVLAQVCERHLLLPDAKLADVFPAMPSGAVSLRVIRT